LLVPRETALFGKLLAEHLRDRFQVLRVLHRVLDHRLRKGTPRPVGLLAALVEGQSAKLFHQRAVAEGLQPEQLGRQHRVEDRLRLRRPGPPQHAQVEIRAVQDPRVAACRRPKLIERKIAQRIEQKMLVGMRDLDEADALAIVMQAVGLGIERERKITAQAGDEMVERARRIDPKELDRRGHEAERMPQVGRGMKKEVWTCGRQL
jgi:hypothetical protein